MQNIQKNKLLTDIILKSNKKFDIIFIQKPLWSFVQLIVSSLYKEGDSLVGAPNHSDWFTFSRTLSNDNNSSRVISYINVQLSYLCFSLRKNIFSYRDICYFSFFNNSDIYYIINVYFDANQIALKYLKNTEANIHNILVMAGDLILEIVVKILWFLFIWFIVILLWLLSPGHSID